MRARIWEDAAAMGVVSVLGFLLNDDGEVVGAERTQVLCKLMPSVHTLTHRAILAMLVVGLGDADAQIFYAEKGLKVLNAWLQDGLGRKKEPGMSKEKRRVEMFSQVRALLRILDVNVQTDAARKQNAFLAPTIPKAIELLDNAGADFAAEWSKLNIYRRHFESSCGVVSTVKDSRGEPAAKRPRPASAANGSGATTSTGRPAPAASLSRTSSSTPATSVSTTASTAPTGIRSAGMTSSRPAGAAAAAAAAASVLEYQPKSFLQPDSNANKPDDELDEYVEEEDDDMLAGVGVITNVGQPTINASLDLKIRNNGHLMQYAERTPCRFCHRMTAKRCDHCSVCVKCAQRDRCQPPPAAADAGANSNDASPATSTTSSSAGDAVSRAPNLSARPGGVMSAEERTKQVLGSAMDQAIYKAFRCEDFHSAFSLITNGMDVNFQRVESDYSTVLMAAAHHGRDDAATKLLGLGANPCIADKEGNLAWTFADRRGHKELMEKLKKVADEWKEKHPESRGSAPTS